MPKREKARPDEKFYKMNEREATKQYLQTLAQIKREEGVVAATGYELKSSLYSLGKRLANFFDAALTPPDKYVSDAENARMLKSTVAPPGGRFLSQDYPAWEKRVKDRPAERKAFILRARKTSHLETTAATMAIIGIIGAIFFFSTSMTGNVIGNLTNSGEKIIGSIFVLVALVGAFFWMRSK